MEAEANDDGQRSGNGGRESMAASRSLCSGALRRLRACLPLSYRTEIVQVAKLSGPVFIAQLMIFLINFVSTVFCGHLGKLELAAVTLATAIINVTGISVGSGLSSACDTLISQTYGSGNLRRVGVILQRGILILLLACCPCWALLINTESILLVVRQEPAVARLAQLYVKIFMPALPASFLYQLQGRYLQNQGIIWPQVITGAVGNVVNALVNYIFIYVLDLGVAGSAAANTVSQYSLALILYIYILCRGLHKATWAGWSTDCLQEWDTYIRLAIPSMLMLCLEWWIYEIGGFLAGLISEVELGAQSVIYGVANLAYMFPLGFGVAASVRVGHALGSRDPDLAKLSSKVSIMCAVLVAVCIAVVAAVSKDVIAYIFTNDEQIRERAAKVMMVYAPFHLFDATAVVLGGVVRGTGKQILGAVCNLVGYYCVGFPIGVSLMFPAKMGIFGLWIGLFICVILQSTFFFILIAKLDWCKATSEALIRAGVQVIEDQQSEPQMRECYQEIPEDIEHNELDHTGLEWLTHVEPRVAITTVGNVLPFRMLVLRRGLVTVLMLLVLVGGILINKFLNPAPT